MESIRWHALIAERFDGLAERVAIYDERFPAELAALPHNPTWFTLELAVEVLELFAGMWPSLGRQPNDPSNERSAYLSVPEVGPVRLIGRNLAHPNDRGAQVVVFTVVQPRQPGTPGSEPAAPG